MLLLNLLNIVQFCVRSYRWLDYFVTVSQHINACLLCKGFTLLATSQQVVIHYAFCLDVAHDHVNGAPNETRTHSGRFANNYTTSYNHLTIEYLKYICKYQTLCLSRIWHKVSFVSGVLLVRIHCWNELYSPSHHSKVWHKTFSTREPGARPLFRHAQKYQIKRSALGAWRQSEPCQSTWES